jgi:hypothetical protein
MLEVGGYGLFDWSGNGAAVYEGDTYNGIMTTLGKA